MNTEEFLVDLTVEKPKMETPMLSKKRKAVESEFNAPQVFQGYEMNFLRKSVKCHLVDNVSLSKKKFNYKVGMSKRDVDMLNRQLARLEHGVKVSLNDCYINGKLANFYDENGESCVFQEDSIWSMSILLQGYKIGPTGHSSPIWRIDEAKIA